MAQNDRVAFCGLVCQDCPARIATLQDDWFARRELAAQWTTRDYPILAEDINCEGCQPGGERVFIYCRECEIRRCGIKREVQTCASCDQYPCDLIRRAPTGLRERIADLRA